MSVCKSVSLSSPPPHLWGVIRGGSSVRWMCNCISPSFSFFLPLFLTLSPSQFFSVFASLRRMNWPSLTGSSGAFQRLCVLLGKDPALYAYFTEGHDCVRAWNHTRARIQINLADYTCDLPTLPLLFCFLLFWTTGAPVQWKTMLLKFLLATGHWLNGGCPHAAGVCLLNVQKRTTFCM